MDKDLVRIFRVTSSDTVQPGFRQYVIHATKVHGPSESLSLQTVNAFAASLCERARELSKPIVIEHERTKYGETLKKAYFVKVEADRCTA